MGGEPQEALEATTACTRCDTKETTLEREMNMSQGTLLALLREHFTFETANAYFSETYSWELERRAFTTFGDFMLSPCHTRHGMARGEHEESTFWILFNRATLKYLTMSEHDLRAMKQALLAF